MPTITGTAADDILLGTAGVDIIEGLAGKDTLYGSDGDDFINGGEGDDTLYGNAGNDRLDGGLGNDILEGGDGNDVMYDSVGSGSDTLRGGAGNDILHDGFGHDVLDGGDGDDFILLDDYWSSGRYNDVNTVIGGAGYDTLQITGSISFSISSAVGGTFSSWGSTFNMLENSSGFERVIGGNFADQMNFKGLPTSIELFGEGGDDFLAGGLGQDTLWGGVNNDRLVIGSGDVAYGEDGDDQFEVNVSGGLSLPTRAIGGAGVNSLTITQFAADTTVDVASGHLGNLIFSDMRNLAVQVTAGGGVILGDDKANVITVSYNGFPSASFLPTTVHGGGGDDIIKGDQLNAILYGEDGNDQLTGSNGSVDRLYGGAGDDSVQLTTGGDVLDGGEGVDTLVLSTGISGDVRVSLDTGWVVIGDGSPSNTATVSGFENVVGNNGNDTIVGDDRANVIKGGSGNDVLFGGGGDDRLEGGDGADRLNGGDGQDVLVGSTGDTVEGGDGFDTLVFSSSIFDVKFSNENGLGVLTTAAGKTTLSGMERIIFSDVVLDVGPNGTLPTVSEIFGSNGDDALVGTAGPDRFISGTGNDRLTGGGGSDLLDGGAGYDIAIFSGLRLQYGLSAAGVSGGPEGGIDRLVSIEEAQFVDGSLSFDPDGKPAQILRLYDAALDRAPDQYGLAANVQALTAGATLAQLATGFVNGSEFQARYGALSNQAFVEQLYRFCMNREGDAPGIRSWTFALETGLSRAELLVTFSESAEHRVVTAPTLALGLFTQDQAALTIARLYDATFDRLPDTGGLTGWTAALKSGMSLDGIASAFAGSTEFQLRYGALSDQAFVENLYRFCLNREGDPAGIQNWVNNLNAGVVTRASVLIQFSEGSEHVALTSSLWAGGIQYSGYQASQSGSMAATSNAKAMGLELYHIDTGEPAAALDGAIETPTTHVVVDPAISFEMTADDFLVNLMAPIDMQATGPAWDNAGIDWIKAEAPVLPEAVVNLDVFRLFPVDDSHAHDWMH